MRFARLLLLVSIALVAALPQAGHAMQTASLNFAQGSVNATWRGTGPISMSQVGDGIRLTTGAGTGMFLAKPDLPFLPQAIAVVAVTEEPVTVSLIWEYDNDPEVRYSIPVTIGSTKESNPFTLTKKDFWYAGKKQIGLLLPPGTSITLYRIDLLRWNFMETLQSAFGSFWSFDAMQAYNINFVWGPLIGFNPVEVGELYTIIPPKALSGTFAINIALILMTGVVALLMYLQPHRKHIYFRRGATILLVVWVLFDLRMGGEFLSWMYNDAKTYGLVDEGQRTFRNRDRFYDFADFAKPLVADRSDYIFFAEREWPYLGNMRYITYPSIPGNDFEKDDTWVIYNRSDLTVSKDGRLMLLDEPVTDPGTVLGQFDETSFVFRVPLVSPPAQ